MVSLTCTALLDIQKMAFEKERRDLREAAEFEARVAVELTRMPEHRPPCEYGEEGLCTIECDSPWLSCREARLKWARLKVEEEMYNEKR